MKDIEQILYRYGDLKELAVQCEERVREIIGKKIALLDSMLRPPVMDDVKIQSGGAADPVIDAVHQLVDVYDEEIKREAYNLRMYSEEQERIRRRIEAAALTKREDEYLEMRYVERMSNRMIAKEMGYEERNAYKIRMRVLQKIGKAAKHAG